jgi:hypothetical protein
MQGRESFRQCGIRARLPTDLEAPGKEGLALKCQELRLGQVQWLSYLGGGNRENGG